MTTVEETKKFVTHYAFKVDDELLGGVIGFTSLYGAVRTYRTPDKRRFSYFLVMVAVACLALAFLTVDIHVSDSSESEGLVIQSVFDNANEAEDAIEKVTVQEQEGSTGKSSASVIDWAQGIVADLGLSFGWAAFYFSVFGTWLDGQTPGKRLFGIKVLRVDGDRLGLWESFGRYGGYSAGLATGLLGFLQVYWDPNRQAIHDKISETVVVDLRRPSAPLSTQNN